MTSVVVVTSDPAITITQDTPTVETVTAISGALQQAANLGSAGQGGVIGNLPVTNLNSGSAASATTFWNGTGAWDSAVTSVTTDASLTGGPITGAGTLGVTSGSVIGSAIGTYAANSGLTTAIPADDTIPQITEGTQVISVSYTPLFSTSTLLCVFAGQVAAAAADNVTAAIFNGASNAIAAEMINISASSVKCGFSVIATYAPGATTAQTISVRVGGATQNVSLNGVVGTRFLGGSSMAVLTIFEIR